MSNDISYGVDKIPCKIYIRWICASIRYLIFVIATEEQRYLCILCPLLLNILLKFIVRNRFIMAIKSTRNSQTIRIKCDCFFISFVHFGHSIYFVCILVILNLHLMKHMGSAIRNFHFRNSMQWKLPKLMNEQLNEWTSRLKMKKK